MLWHKGVQTYDFYRKKQFHICAILLWTSHDFLRYTYLSGWIVKDKLSYSLCYKYTCAPILEQKKKMFYMEHQWGLPMHHPYRANKYSFDGIVDYISIQD